ncbi:MAG TPA: hypothetical protein VEK74_13010 [Burkholderiaceae bacterium]|nr:hypothetical protein [Burkholderiaceae bacterium]HYA75805.1 hypothetical protein [Burkholderiaceae bacterium]
MMRTATTLWSRAASGTLAAASLLALLAWVWRLAIVSDRHDTFWIELTIVATIGGVVALGWLRSPRVAMTAPQIMLLLGAAGMVAGLTYDEHSGGFTALVSLCQAGKEDFLGTLQLHWRLLPAMHLGMIAGGLATVPLLRTLRRGCRRQFCARLVQNLACSAWMIAGMSAGVLGFLQLATWAGGRSPTAMLGGMFAGMVWGMVASVALYRLWFALIAPRLVREEV